MAPLKVSLGERGITHMLSALGLVLTVSASIGAVWVIGRAFDETD
ncbi:MAG: hypothetical protein ABL894_08385 [Hyphomicrobium sp.]